MLCLLKAGVDGGCDSTFVERIVFLKQKEVGKHEQRAQSSPWSGPKKLQA